MKVTADNPGEITIVALGRLTNLALALELDPNFASNVNSVVMMGGAIGRNGFAGNVSPCAEANIAGDPHAAILFSRRPATDDGWARRHHENLMQDDYVQSIRSEGGETGEFIYEISRFYAAFHRDAIGMSAFPVHDSSAIAYVIQPELFQTEIGAIRVVTDGLAIGQTVFAPAGESFPPGPWDNVPHKQVCVDVNSDAFLELYLRTVTGA